MQPKNNTYALIDNPNTLVKAVVTKDSDTVSFWAIDGGHQFTVPKEVFEKDFRLSTDLEIHHHYKPKQEKQYVALDDSKGYLAYVPNATWNGWAMPSFPADQALKLLHDMKLLNDCDYRFQIKRGDEVISVDDVSYLKPSDIILMIDPNYDEECDSITEVKPGITHGENTWSIGAGSWVWSVVELDEDLLIEHIEFEMDVDDYELTDAVRGQALKLLAEENMDYKEIAKALIEPLSSNHDLLDDDNSLSQNSPSM